MTPRPVLVVGAGPTGLLLAAELRRRGIDCEVIDLQPDPLHWDRATVVHPRSLEVFESLGILDAFLEAGVKQRVIRVHSDGSLLGEVDLASCGSRHGFNLGISEDVTEALLDDYLHRQGGDVHRSRRLVSLEPRSDGVLARIEGDGPSELLFEWVVACDGYHSATRELAGIELQGHDIPAPWAVFDATASGWSGTYEGNYAFLDAIPVILTALPGRRWRVYMRPSSEEADLVAEATATLARYQPEASFRDVAFPRRFYCHTKMAAHYRSGRILVAGDAAHTCSPSEGHGMNSGIQDAFNLAWKLALVASGRCAPGLLDSYEAERRPVADMITRSGDATEHAQTLADPDERRARDGELRAALADPASRHDEAVAEAELGIDYGDSPIVMGDTHPSLSPGQRLPDTIALRLPGGGERGLHQLAHRAGHTVFVLSGPSRLGESCSDLASSVVDSADRSLVEATVPAFSNGEGPTVPRLDPADAERLGIEELTLLAVRPDGHVGLRADRGHLKALTAYEQLLRSSGDG